MGIAMKDEWMTVEEIAEEFKVAAQTIHQWRKETNPDDRLQVYQVKGIIRIKRSDFEEFLQRHTNID